MTNIILVITYIYNNNEITRINMQREKGQWAVYYTFVPKVLS